MIAQRSVQRHFYALWIDNHELQITRVHAVQQRRNDRVDTYRFAFSSCTGNEQVRHLRQVGTEHFTDHCLAHRQRKLDLWVVILR